MFRSIIVPLLLVPSLSFAQLYINKTKSQVKEEIGKNFFGKDNISATISETDSSLVMKVRGKGTTEADYTYNFDSSGKCNTEKTVTWCDSCHEKLLQNVFAMKKYGWKKINANQYVSKFSEGMLLGTHVANSLYSFSIVRTNLNKKMYKFLLDNN